MNIDSVLQSTMNQLQIKHRLNVNMQKRGLTFVKCTIIMNVWKIWYQRLETIVRMLKSWNGHNMTLLGAKIVAWCAMLITKCNISDGVSYNIVI